MVFGFSLLVSEESLYNIWISICLVSCCERLPYHISYQPCQMDFAQIVNMKLLEVKVYKQFMVRLSRNHGDRNSPCVLNEYVLRNEVWVTLEDILNLVVWSWQQPH